MRTEPINLTNTLGRANLVVAMFGSPLVGFDHELRYPILSSVPQLNTDTWRILPDGRMETIYGLKPGLSWHDGEPLTADDVVFAHEVDGARIRYGLSTTSTAEFNMIEAVIAQSPRTVVIRWRQLNADAAHPTLSPLPEHVLGKALEQAAIDPNLLGSHPYWTTEYVGLGPYRLTHWEAGAFIDAAAFDGYALGRPRIDRILLTWNGDPNILGTRLLARDADLAPDLTLEFEQAVTLRREWSRTGDGVVILTPSDTRFVGAQLRPAYATPSAILDLRVRKASLHAIDRRALADALFEGEGLVAETNALPSESFYEDLNRVAPKYSYDPRRTEALMNEAGFVKGPDGMYSSASEGRFAPEVLGIAEGQEGKETTAVADYFRQAGINAQLRLVPNAQIGNDLALRATYPAWRTNYGTNPMKWYGPDIATQENRWAGGNKLGWLNSENDRLVDLWKSSLDEGERNQILLQAYRNMNDELPDLPLYYNYRITAHTADLKGPQGTVPDALASHYGNLHEWQWIR